MVFDFLKKQFIDVIQWNEEEDGVLAFKYPMMDKEIQNGAQLTVRETQLALFLNEGELADVFEPGLHTLNTNTLPLLTNLKNWDKGFESPFKSDVIFFSTREQLDLRWGTANPVTIRDKEFGAIRLRAHGSYTYKVKNPKVFFNKVSGTRDKYYAEELNGQIRAIITTSMAAFFGNSDVGFVDMAANQLEFSENLQGFLQDEFDNYGLELEKFLVQSISLPQELQDKLDKKASMNMVGDLQKYAQFEAADNIGTAAANPGGIAGAGVGVGAGVAIGQTMAGALGQAGGAAAAAPTQEDPIVMLEKLADLHKKGILSDDEFTAKKKELLAKI